MSSSSVYRAEHSPAFVLESILKADWSENMLHGACELMLELDIIKPNQFGELLERVNLMQLGHPLPGQKLETANLIVILYGFLTEGSSLASRFADAIQDVNEHMEDELSSTSNQSFVSKEAGDNRIGSTDGPITSENVEWENKISSLTAENERLKERLAMLELSEQPDKVSELQEALRQSKVRDMRVMEIIEDLRKCLPGKSKVRMCSAMRHRLEHLNNSP